MAVLSDPQRKSSQMQSLGQAKLSNLSDSCRQIRCYSGCLQPDRILVQEIRMSPDQTLRNDSRRTFLKFSVAAAAASAFRIVNEPMLAAAAVDRDMQHFPPGSVVINANENPLGDRKSTRLNSSHLGISYAVFCLKKKNNNTKST